MWGLFAWISCLDDKPYFIYVLFIYLFILLFAKYCIQDGHPPTVSVL